MLCKPV